MHKGARLHNWPKARRILNPSPARQRLALDVEDGTPGALKELEQVEEAIAPRIRDEERAALAATERASRAAAAQAAREAANTEMVIRHYYRSIRSNTPAGRRGLDKAAAQAGL